MSQDNVLKLVQQLKHMAGKHPQKTHAGSRGSGIDLPNGLRLYKSYPPGKNLNGYFITPSDDILDFSNYSGDEDQAYHLGIIEDNYDDKSFRKVMKFTSNDLDELDEDSESGLYLALHRGSVRVASEMQGALSLQTSSVNNSTLRRLQSLYDEGKFPIMRPGARHYWEDKDESKGLSFTTEEFLTAKYVTGTGYNVKLKQG